MIAFPALVPLCNGHRQAHPKAVRAAPATELLGSSAPVAGITGDSACRGPAAAVERLIARAFAVVDSPRRLEKVVALPGRTRDLTGLCELLEDLSYRVVDQRQDVRRGEVT